MLSDIRFFNRPPAYKRIFCLTAATPVQFAMCCGSLDCCTLYSNGKARHLRRKKSCPLKFRHLIGPKHVDAHLHANYDNATRDIIMLVACSGS